MLFYDDNEAETLARKYQDVDPYPDIEPALLNSADIMAYVKQTGLISPFHPDNLKGASYDVTIKGDVVYYEPDPITHVNGRKTFKLENDGDYFELLPNSIAFVTLEPTFRIPSYLALRFNLKITHIYKGLLLGTGPLVDPGFIGKLSIPLHNLTENTYRFYKGDQLITMEFTKMSPYREWLNGERLEVHNEKYIKTDIRKERTVLEYIAKALGKDGLSTVVSSIPSAIADSKAKIETAQQTATKATDDAKKLGEALEKKATLQTAVSIIAVCTLVISSVGLSINAVTKANDRYDKLFLDYITLEETFTSKVDELTKQIISLEERINDITSVSADTVVD